MLPPELIFVVGCNAAGKSTFIRTRLSQLGSFEVIMTDVYKNRKSFEMDKLVVYFTNELNYPQLFARYGFSHDRIHEEAYNVIQRNFDFME